MKFFQTNVLKSKKKKQTIFCFTMMLKKQVETEKATNEIRVD